MNYYAPQPTAPRPERWTGVVWIIGAAGALTVTPMLWLMVGLTMGWGRDCSSPPGAPYDVPAGCASEGLSALASMSMLGSWILVTVVVSVVFGVLEGRYRRFAYKRRTCAVLVTLATPWAMAGYALGNGLGRLSPAPVGGSFDPPPYPHL
ncbi:hypothetical protein [Actinoplanes sp. NPDC026623]|uniref:hypothetical protein n=1 Tax=Actinoplanes sp. NPDC026623 TaxID=3155610 RepID=UPI0033E1F9BD